MRAFGDEVRAGLRHPMTVAGWVFVTVIMALAGPFGSYGEVSIGRRLAFWLVVTAVAVVLSIVVRVAVFSRLGLTDFWRGGTLVSATVALLTCWPVTVLMERTAGDRAFMAPETLEMAIFIFCLTMGFCAFRHWLEHMGQSLNGDVAAQSAGSGQSVADDSAELALPRLAERLPEELRGPVHRVSGRDHYVEIATNNGTSTVLMRFSDALAELDGADGLQIHRSHWVSTSAVAEALRKGSRVFLRLHCGVIVPVSRTYLPQVIARGWLVQD